MFAIGVGSALVLVLGMLGPVIAGAYLAARLSRRPH